jgi:hypothetical protein
MRPLALLAAVALLAPLAFACGPGSSHNNNNNTPPVATTPPVVQPLTVLIDTDQTMTATGGDGVGVFVEYATGGQWRLWWTCDTTHSNLSCGFTIGGNVEVGAGGIRNLTGDSAAQLVNGGLSISSTTATEVHEIGFDTNAGTKLTLDARVQGIDPSTSFFFFVQDGKINGGFKGKLTNPLIFQPTTP